MIGRFVRLGLDAQERRQSGAVAQIQREQRDLDTALLEPGQAFGQRRRDLEPVRLATNGIERGTHLGVLVGVSS